MKHVPRIYSSNDLDCLVEVRLTQEKNHHLLNVMRINEGQVVRLFNEKNGEWNARIHVRKNQVSCVCEEQIRAPSDEPGFSLIFSMISPQKMHMILEKATELGVSDIYPVITQYTQNKAFNLEKAKTILVNSAEQCNRLTVPNIHAPMNLNELLNNWDHNNSITVGDLVGESSKIDVNCSSFLVGPEGGFSESEQKLIASYKFVKVVRLCNNILRAETAALAFGAIWAARHIFD